jgi:hypothetical protein
MKDQIKLLMVLIFAIAVFSTLSPDGTGNSSSRFVYKNLELLSKDIDEWRERIKIIGAEKAYDAFAKSVDGLREEVQHDLVHVFGTALYEEEGIDGLPVCDSQFFYGCFHEFVALAVADRGTESAAELNQVCLNSFEGNELQSCQHGIGHGIQSIYGYTQKDLNFALNQCSELPQNNISGGGCYGGIFMEYNLRTMLSDDGRVRESENIFSPCDSVEEKFREACTYWNPQWWRTGPLMYLNTTREAYEKMGDYCRDFIQSMDESELEQKKLRRVCFGGIGGIAAPDAAFDTQYTAELCDAASESETESAICRANAAYRTIETPDVETALHVCDGLTGNALSYCSAFAKSDYDKIQELSSKLNI